MALTNSPFIIKHHEGFGGNFVDSQYLGRAYEVGKPHVFENTLMKIYSSTSRFFNGKNLIGMTGAKAGGTKEIPTEVYRWKLQGAEEKSARSLEDLEASNPAPGLNNQTFRIKLDLDFYANPDVLFGEDNDFPLEVVSGPVQDGNGYIYTVRIQGDDPTVSLPSKYLEPGREFNKVWTSVASEFNERFGTQQIPNSFELESQVGAFAQKLTVTDKAMREEGRLEVEFLYTSPRTGKTQKVSKFWPAYQARMEDELYMSMEAAMTYGKKQTQPGHKGYWIKTGPGMREQLRDSWISNLVPFIGNNDRKISLIAGNSYINYKTIRSEDKNKHMKYPIGTKIGELTVKGTKNKGQYILECSCGNTVSGPYNFVSRACKSLTKIGFAGCQSCRYNFIRDKKMNSIEKYSTIYHRYKRSAKSRGIKFNLSLQEASDMFSAPCTYCGLLESNTCVRTVFMSYSYTGIDRVDSSKGYTLNNTVPCCKDCNIAKHVKTVDEFFDFIRRVYFYNVQRLSRDGVESSDSKREISFWQEKENDIV